LEPHRATKAAAIPTHDGEFQMTRLATLAVAAAILAGASPAFAKGDCDGGYKNFLTKMNTYVDKMSGYELADAVRKSLDAYNSCTAGDSFSPNGVWDQILADMQTKSHKG
jgi:hypothetical protein